MNREQQIINTTQRKVYQGVSADQQYADLNAARDKRKRRRERNFKTLLSGGYKQVLLIGQPNAFVTPGQILRLP